MVNYPVRSGIDTYLVYAEEPAFASAGNFTSSAGNFGIITDFSTTPNRSMRRITGVKATLPTANTESTARDPQFILKGVFGGDMSVAFIPQEWSWLRYVMGTVSGSGTSAAKFNYPQATGSTTTDKRNYLRIPSMTLSSNYYFEGSGDATSKAWRFLGGKVDSANIKGKVNDTVSASVTVKYADMTGTTTLDTGVALPSTEPYNFTGVSIEYPIGTPIPNILDSFDLTINNAIEVIPGMGSDVGKAGKEMKRESTLKITVKQEGTGFLDDFMGAATSLSEPVEISEIKITLTSTTANKKLIVHCLRCKLADESLPNQYPNIVDETITLIPQVVYFEEQTSA